MSRPSTEIIEKFDVINQFKRYALLCFSVSTFLKVSEVKNDKNIFAVWRNGIKSVINLQMVGEHASCGKPLEPDSGFSYRPEVFMENNSMYFGMSLE